jgi:hypothetical protein
MPIDQHAAVLAHGSKLARRHTRASRRQPHAHPAVTAKRVSLGHRAQAGELGMLRPGTRARGAAAGAESSGPRRPRCSNSPPTRWWATAPMCRPRMPTPRRRRRFDNIGRAGGPDRGLVCRGERGEEKEENGGAHYLEGGVEGLQEWRLGGGIWRGLKNGGSFRGPAGVDFLHSTSKFWSRGPYGSPHKSCSKT